jgi:septum formation protein
MQPLVLASSSKYRKEQLQRLGISFITATPNVDESRLAGEDPQETALRLSILKARAIAEFYPSSLIIGSDQVACLDSAQLGKPLTHENAVNQLSLMQGREVFFFTGVCLLNANNNNVQSNVIRTIVKLRSLSKAQIENYLIKEQPYDCAGSAKSEGLGIALIEYIRGDDPNALIGLPLIDLVTMLKNEGINAV